MLPILLTSRAVSSRFTKIPEHFYFLNDDDGSAELGIIKVESDHYREPIEFIFSNSREPILTELHQIYRNAVA